MKIGIIGAGKIGGTLGALLAKAGHTIRFGVRNPQALRNLVESLAPHAAAGSAAEAAAFGDIVMFAGPFGAWPDFAAANAAALAGKTVIDTANPYPARDGVIAERATASGRGSGRAVAAWLPGAHVVKAFNTIYWIDLRDQAHRAGEQLAMPIAGDDARATTVTQTLARDAGFDPVVIGGLERSGALDPGSPIYAKSFTVAQVRAALDLTA